MEAAFLHLDYSGCGMMVAVQDLPWLLMIKRQLAILYNCGISMKWLVVIP